VSNGVIHGRGACDAKGIAATMICAAERMRAEGVPVSLLFVVGEEVSHDGAHAANGVPNSSKVLINGEPTESTLARGTKGAVRMILRTRGVPAHSAYPELGRSATVQLARLLVELQDLDLPRDALLGETTINVGVISGGVADNVVAPAAEARLMARLVGPQEELLELIRGWLAGRAELEAGVAVPAMHLEPIEGFKTSVVSFATDMPVLTNWGKPYLFGPGSIHVAHGDNEFVSIAELVEAVSAYERLADAALRRAGAS
jgi:acetylornithine deacetylase